MLHLEAEWTSKQNILTADTVLQFWEKNTFYGDRF